MKRQFDKTFKSVLVANHMQEGLDLLQRTPHWRGSLPSEQMETILPGLDLILVNIEMPVMGGVECVKRIRALEEEGTIRKHIPIFPITANARSKQLWEYVDVGMDETLSKPFSIRDLVTVITRLLSFALAIRLVLKSMVCIGNMHARFPLVKVLVCAVRPELIFMEMSTRPWPRACSIIPSHRETDTRTKNDLCIWCPTG